MVYQNTILIAKGAERRPALRVQAGEYIARVVSVDTDVGRGLQRQGVVHVLEQDDASGTHLADE